MTRGVAEQIHESQERILLWLRCGGYIAQKFGSQKRLFSILFFHKRCPQWSVCYGNTGSRNPSVGGPLLSREAFFVIFASLPPWHLDFHFLRGWRRPVLRSGCRRSGSSASRPERR